MGWEVFAASTLTGEVGALLDVASGSWSDVINDAAEIRARVPTDQLVKELPRWWWSPWSGALLACHDGVPVAFGPIIKEPSGGPHITELEGGGFWSLMDMRVATPGDYTDGAALAAVMFNIEEGSLGTIAVRLVQSAQDRPSGWLPVTYRSPIELGNNRVRNYKGFNLSNNSVGKLLRELTAVINGPDIAFRPEWVPGQEGHRVQWGMWHGTEAVPFIQTEHPYTADLAAPRSGVVAPRVTADYTPYGRVYATGAGEDEGTLVRINTGPMRENLPMLETVISDTQTENADLLDSRSHAILNRGRIVQITTEHWDPNTPLHATWAGDEAQLVWPDGWPQLPAGTYRARALSRSGSFTDTKMRIEFQAFEDPPW